jgi:perosamine synthetase
MPSFAISPARLRLYATPFNIASMLRDTLLGRFNAGKDVEQLEETVASQVGMSHAVAMPMARVAIYCAIKALITPGQVVILSPYTIVDVVNMVLCAGGRPVFADTAPDRYNISAEDVKALLATEENVGAVMVTHFYGELCDVEPIAAMCRERNIPLIEDAAQAFGAHRNGIRSGAFGDVGIYSFGLYKNVNSVYGGMVVARDPKVSANIRQLVSDWPQQSVMDFLPKMFKALVVDLLTRPFLFKLFAFRLFRFAYLNDIGPITNQLRVDVEPEVKSQLPEEYKKRMSPAQARVILRQLGDVEANNRRRIANAERYINGLRGQPLTLPPLRDDGSSIYTYLCVRFDDRRSVVRYLQQQGRDVAENYHRNCADLDIFKPYYRDCPNARRMSEGLVYLPSYPDLSMMEIDKTVAALRDFFQEPAYSD